MRGALAGAMLAGILGASACATTATAVAHTPATTPEGPPPMTADGQAQYAFESSILGRRHALAHALAGAGPSAATRQAPAGESPVPAGTTDAPFDPCRARGPASRYEARPLPPKNRPTGQARCGTLPPQPRSRGKLARVGRWSPAVMDLPHYAIHAALLHTGKVIFWGYEWTQHLITKTPGSHQNTSSETTVWNPRRGARAAAMRSVLPPMIDVDGDGIPEHAPLYCSGQSTLPDGRLLVTGGTLDLRWAQHGYTAPPGLRIVLVFDPRTETWSRMPDMKVARWYPTQVELADGRTLVLGGFDDARPTGLTHTLEVVSPDGRTVTHAASGDRETWTYPGLLLMPDARVLLAGPRRQDTGLLDPRTLTWSPVARLPQTRGGENLVPVPARTGSSPEAMIIGGADFEAQGRGRTVPAYTSTLTFDARRPAAGWKPAASLRRPRNWPNTVLLPDGSMVAVGGGTAITGRDIGYAADGTSRHVELWDPQTRRWHLGPAQREDRAYHSVALLLPDGRVWSAGDDANPNRDGDTAEIYEPPYLFRGARPRIVAAPQAITTRRAFTLKVRGPVPERLTMLAPGNTTHARDMQQRFIELKIGRRAVHGDTTTLTVTGPRSLAAAPPGPWMLFALSARGAPSAAHWTRLS